MIETYRVLKSDGDHFCILLGEEALRRDALTLAREHHAHGDDVQVRRITESGFDFCVAQGYANEDFIIL
jgi:hypothetical protein